MAEQQAWVIGAAPECDLVVDHPTVSGRHCRLARTDDGFLLEDLDSTNGTFVNGTRISAPLSVNSTDEIKLGPETRFPWEMIESSPADRQIIRIGRAADNDVVLDYSNVSNNHARIVIEGGKATIEDLGSTNGIAIGKPDNLAKSAPLSETDTVYFGSLAISAADLLHPGREPAVIPMPSAKTKPGASTRSIFVAIASFAVAAVLATAVINWLKPDGTSPEKPTADATASDDTPVPDPPPVTEVAKDPADAIYSVMVQKEGTDGLLRIGTAWAVGEHQLVTSGVVALYLERHGGDIAAVQVRSAPTERMLVANHWDAHPEFKEAEAATKALAEAAREKRQELDALKAAAEPPGEDKLNAMVNGLIEAEENLFLAGERMAFYDIGLLTVEETLPFVLEIEQSQKKLPVQTKMTLYGVPYDRQAMVAMDPQKPSKLEGRLLRVVQPAGETSSPLRRLLVSAPADHHAKEWRGSPVLNDKERVVGVYVRPTLPVDPAKPPTGESFDAVLIEQLKGLPVDFPTGHK